jgi:hypothetical protein
MFYRHRYSPVKQIKQPKTNIILCVRVCVCVCLCVLGVCDKGSEMQMKLTHIELIRL